MSNHILVVTHLEEPKVLLVQNKSAEEILQTAKFDRLLHNRCGWLHELKPAAVQHSTTFGGITLNRLGHTEKRGAFELYLAEAMYYASIAGVEQTPLLLTKALKVVYDALNHAKHILEVNQGPPVKTEASPPPPPDTSDSPTGK